MSYIDTFEDLKATRSRNVKIEILEDANNATKDILELTYNPFKHYFINKVPAYKPADGVPLSKLSHTGYKSLLYELHTRELSGNEALTVVQAFMSALTLEDAEIFKNILRKDQRCGTGVATINKAIPGLIPDFGAMLAKKYTPERYQSGLMMSLKYDGVRAIFKGGNLFTRNGHKIIGINHITDHIPEAWSFDGELTIPDMHFQEASGLIRNDDPTPAAVYNVFDIPEVSAPFDTRYYMYMGRIEELSRGYTIPILPVKHVEVRSEEHIQETFQKALAGGYEGLVIKPKGHKYVTSRSWNWMKLKAEHSEDLPVVGFFEGEGKYEGQLGGLMVERKNGVVVKVGSGFSDAERESIWHAQSTYTNTLIQVNYHEETPDGSLRHPVYKGFRWDKDEVN